MTFLYQVKCNYCDTVRCGDDPSHWHCDDCIARQKKRFELQAEEMAIELEMRELADKEEKARLAKIICIICKSFPRDKYSIFNYRYNNEHKIYCKKCMDEFLASRKFANRIKRFFKHKQ